MFSSETQIRVRYGETDKMGYCYYGNYPLYYEAARSDAFRNSGCSYRQLEESGYMMPVVSMSINYMRPAFYDDLLTIKVYVKEMPGVKMTFFYETYNEKGELQPIGPNDRQIISLEPNFVGGFNTRVAWKGIDLNIIGAFQSGGKLISTLYGASGYLNMLTGRRGNVKVDYWTPENKDAKYPKPGGIQSGDNQKYGSTLGLFDGGFCKIRNITLGYNFDKKVVKNLGLSSLRVYATVQNPFIIYSPYYDESGLDPEPNSMSTQGQFHATQLGGHALPVVGTNSPCTRNYLFGLNVTF